MKNTFKSFVMGPSNRIAYEAARKVAQSPGKAFNPLHICGETGLGATHLMRAISHAVIKRYPRAKVALITGEAFTIGLIAAIQRTRLADFRKHYRGLDVLLLDDIQFLAGKEHTQAELIMTFKDLLAARKQIVLTSDWNAVDIPQVDPRLIYLCYSGLVATLRAPDYETRIAILRKKGMALKVLVPDEVLEHIAGHTHTNIRCLEGALIRVCAYCSLTGRQLTMANVDTILLNNSL